MRSATVAFAASLALAAGLFLLAAPASAVDADHDTLDDALEQQLAVRHAPVVWLDPYEWNYPANVDWFLDRARMRFHHSCSALAMCCGDHQLLDYGLPDQVNLISQAHGKRAWSLFQGCHHTDTQYSDRDFDEDHCFFLQLQDGDHSGSYYPWEWKVYVHSYPNTYGGISLQYWFFYSYNDGMLTFNHEGDWENVVVVLDGSQNVVQVLFARHDDDYHAKAPSAVTWYGGTHPMVLSALGSHASYESFDACAGDWREQGCAWGFQDLRWFTWSGGLPAGELGIQGGGLVMVGEKSYPLNGQTFIRYSGRWGEIGTNVHTSGPRGPAYQGKWDYGRASSGSGGGGGGGVGGCDDPTMLICEPPL